MKLEEYKQRYIAEKEKVEGNLLIIEAEAKRVRAIALRFEGALAFINELEQAEAGELKQKLESRESLSEEDIQRALNQTGQESPPLEPEPSEDHVMELVSEEPKSPVEPDDSVPVPSFDLCRKDGI